VAKELVFELLSLKHLGGCGKTLRAVTTEFDHIVYGALNVIRHG
jgi:hypothetical protein